MTISSVVVHGERRNLAQSDLDVDYFLAVFVDFLQPYQISHPPNFNSDQKSEDLEFLKPGKVLQMSSVMCFLAIF